MKPEKTIKEVLKIIGVNRKTEQLIIDSRVIPITEKLTGEECEKDTDKEIFNTSECMKCGLKGKVMWCGYCIEEFKEQARADAEKKIIENIEKLMKTVELSADAHTVILKEDWEVLKKEKELK